MNEKLKVDEMGRLGVSDFRAAAKFPLTIVLDNVRSVHNVGSVFRTADAFRLREVMLCGITAIPSSPEMHKTALGAESLVPFEYHEAPPLDELRQLGYRIAALEQAANSTNMRDYSAPDRVALLLGEEVDGIAPEWLALADDIIEIPMSGQKESFNVSVAAGIALYELATSGKTAKNV